MIENGSIVPTLETSCNAARLESDGKVIKARRLTPREAFRLQGWTDEYFDRAEFVNADNQLYKQVGNSVTINVIYEIAKRFE